MLANELNTRKNFGFRENSGRVWKGRRWTKIAVAIGFFTGGSAGVYSAYNYSGTSKNNTTDMQSTDDISISPSDKYFRYNVSENPSSKVDGPDGMTPSTRIEENQNDNLANSDNFTRKTTDDVASEMLGERPDNPQNSDVLPAVSRQARGTDFAEMIQENIHNHIQFKDYSTHQKREVLYFGIRFALSEVSEDTNLPVAIRERAKQGLGGAKVLMPVDINRHCLKYTFLLTEPPRFSWRVF